MAGKRKRAKGVMLTLQQRWIINEKTVREMFDLTEDEYLELWHEMGCLYAEKMFNKDGLVYGAKMYEGAIRLNIYWKYWYAEWIETCEWYMHWNYSKKNLTDFKKIHLLATKPNTDLLIKIVTDGQKEINRKTKVKA